MASKLSALAGNRSLACGLIVLAMIALLVRTRGYEILGMDSYPAIASGLLRSPADVVTIFTSPSVPGRVPYAFNGFYRPITTISLGFDHLLFGVRPHGYFVTQTLLFGACALALYELARLTLGASAVVGPLAALVVFLLAPSHVETLDVVARRSELLCGLFSMLALLTQARRTDRRASWVAALPATFTLLALVSKTTGIALLPTLFVLVATRSTAAGLVGRTREALLALIPHVLAVALTFAIQTTILGNVGGHIMSRPGGGIDRLPWALAGLTGWLLLPQPALRASAVTWLILAMFGVAVAAALALLMRERQRSDVLATTTRAWSTLVVGAVWLVASASLYGAVGLLQGWYVFVPALAYALLCGALAEILAQSVRLGAPALRTTAAGALALAAIWVCWQARYSMLVAPYTQITRASELTRLYLADLTARVDAAPAGSVLVVPAPPRRLVPEPGEWALDGPLLVPEYAYQSWADCAFPGRKIEVHDRRQAVVSEPSPGAVKLVFKP